MKILHITILYLLLATCYPLYPQLQSSNNILERVGAWSFGPAKAVDLDAVRDLIFLSSGGSVLTLDGTNRRNPQLLNNEIYTLGLVEDLFYDSLNQRLYIAAGEGGLDIWDVSIPTQPQHLSTTEVLYFDVETPVGNVDVFGDYAIVESGFGYVHSLDVSDPLNPIDVSFNGSMGNPARDIYVSPDGQVHSTGAQRYQRLLIQPVGTLNTSGSKDFNPGPYAVFGTSEVAYVGNAGNLIIIDLLLPQFPIWSVTPVGGISDIVVQNNKAYLLNSAGFQIYDVTVHNNPFYLGSTNMSTFEQRLAISEGYAYIPNGFEGLRIIDIGDAANPVEIGSYDVYGGTPDAFVIGDYAYLSQYSDGMIIIDISDPTNPEFVSNFTNADYVNEIYVQDDYAYLADYEGGLRIIDVSSPENPFEVGVLNTVQAWKIKVRGNYAYVINAIPNNPYTLKVIDISNPTLPTELGSYQLPASARSMDVLNNYVYIAANDDGLRIIDVSDPVNPTLAGLYPSQSVQDVQVIENIAYIASSDFNGGFLIINISDPTSPTLIHRYNPTGFLDPFDVAVIGDYAYLGVPVGVPDIILLDISNIHNPIELDSYVPPYGSSDLQAIGSFLYIADGPAGLQILKNNAIVTSASSNDGLLIPETFELRQNYPNPFNPNTMISFVIPIQELVTIKVFNVMGQQVKVLMNEIKNPGSYQINFNAGELPSGTYIYEIRAGDFFENKKMILLK